MPLSEYVLKPRAAVLPGRIVHGCWVHVSDGRIRAIGFTAPPSGIPAVDVRDALLAPGLVDIHVHGGAGHDFMDGTRDAITEVARAHARHGTTSLILTTTTAPASRLRETLELARPLIQQDRTVASPGDGRARIAGAHLYGPFFGPDAVGCHAREYVLLPRQDTVWLVETFADILTGVTLAPEVEGWELVADRSAELGLRIHVGHSNATFEQFKAAVARGASHVDHLFCAMSDKTKLRQRQAYPMQGGVLEGTLLFEYVTTEVIADGKHLSPELLHLAYAVKGPDRLALVTDCNRALDMPDGEYVFGPKEYGTPFIRADNVGILPDRSGLASSCVPLSHCLRYFCTHVPCPMEHAVRMASLTPARIAGIDYLVGSIEPGKFADLVLLDEDLAVRAVIVGGEQIAGAPLPGISP